MIDGKSVYDKVYSTQHGCLQWFGNHVLVLFDYVIIRDYLRFNKKVDYHDYLIVNITAITFLYDLLVSTTFLRIEEH